MDLPLETPSRILRRIQALEAEDIDLPSLPSFHYDDSGVHSSFKASTAAPSMSKRDIQTELEDISEREESHYESTPLPSSHGTRSTIRPLSATSSTRHFANSLRSSTQRKSPRQSFEAEEITSPRKDYDIESEPSLPNIYIQQSYIPETTSDQIVHPSMHTSEIRSRTRSPLSFHTAQTPQSAKYDYSVSLRSESSQPTPRPGPNALVRGPKEAILTRTRTPSLSRTTPSPPSTSPNSTPKSVNSPIPFNREFPSRSPSPNEDLDFQVDRESRQLSEFHRSQNSESSGERYMQTDNVIASSESINPEEDKLSPSQNSALGISASASPDGHAVSSSSSSSGGLVRTPYPKAFLSPTTPDSPIPAPPFAHRPRFAIQDTPLPVPKPENDDLNTPYNRRRSFLLELVNSNARPRMTFPTPHPFARGGITPRPRAHPLSQAWTPSSEVHPSSSSDAESDSPKDRNSFISVASSHDLTVHPRANASFDPTTGVQGVGRFNAPKLNLYMNSLNRQLQEENRVLVERLRKLGDEVELNRLAEQLENNDLKTLEDVAEAEVEDLRQELEKRDLEKEALRLELEAEVQSIRQEKEQLEEDIQKEREGRQEDNAEWKARLAERLNFVNKGVEETLASMDDKINELTSRKIEAENKLRQCEQTILALDEDLELTKRRAEKAENALANNSDLGIELKKANQLIESLKHDIRSEEHHTEELESKLKEAGRREAEAKTSMEEHIEELENELRQALEGQQNAEANALELQTELETANKYADELQSKLSAAQDCITQLESRTNDLNTQLRHLEAGEVQSQQAIHQLENALEDSEKKMTEDEEVLQALRAKVGRLEKDIEQMQRAHVSLSSSTISNRSRVKQVSNAEVEQLETELDEAHKEIGRLNHLLAQSPARKAIGVSKDVRIELLEKERDDLVDRVKSLSNLLASSPARRLGTPTKLATNTPLPRKVSVAWRTPKTPGPPPKDLSWLQDKTSLPDAGPLLAQIQTLQEELHVANDNIDQKVNKLEEAGMGIISLTEKLEDARTRTTTLEDEVGRLVRRDERRTRRLERANCKECGVKIDVAGIMGVDDNEQSSDFSRSTQPNPVTPPSKKLASLRIILQTKTAELDALRTQWATERAELLGKNVVLQDKANVLNRELDAAKVETKKVINVETELVKAKTIVSDLEETLRTERAKLRSLTTEQQQMLREKENVFVQLQRAQSDMDDVRSHLDKVKSENRELELELRAMATADHKARQLQAKVGENHKTIEILRGEREVLITDHASLQKRHQEVSSKLNALRQRLSTSQTAHEEHRHQLDLKVNEIEDLRRELAEKDRVVEKITTEKNQAHADRSDILRTVARLQGDLKRVRRDAETLGKDLKELRNERDKVENRHRAELNQAEKVQKQLSAQIRLANEQLGAHRLKAKKAVAELQSHICKKQVDNQDISLLRIQHKNDCKGLMVHIEYLKTQIRRESIIKEDLVYQKRYLLDVLAKFEKGERQILAAIARLDFPMRIRPEPARKRPALRTIAVVVRFICRTKRINASWKEQDTRRSAVKSALVEARRRRDATKTGQRGAIPN
ncbi:hypothetical protein Clacol_005649 [Clathrus columnatus]|uniref:Pericentrin/AKAP-450 centrosomal targeting domain-containing protein n=1 Tax=Clathrus columnatus TaxID=1419009 RepID=A0AAV5A9X2_9AGAM|nr:hypothetical protein Clacol_005649 [Clathrus columnatus]